MIEDKHIPITLAIADSPAILQVVGFTGREALNEPYRFDIDLSSPDAQLNLEHLCSRTAFLCFGDHEAGVHGHIEQAMQLHAGKCRSLYRISLVPGLQRLATRRQRKIHRNKSVPQLIAGLLEAHGVGSSGFRFEQLVGSYPNREVCVQYDETDLHLLQRLCEEEGIHFRFEHNHTGHLLIFADDPASFPEHLGPLRFQPVEHLEQQTPTISHLAERFATQPDIGRHDHPRPVWSIDANQPVQASAKDDWVSNQSFETGPGSASGASSRSPQHAHQRQLSARTLERLRCERRSIEGRSNHPGLLGGQIIQVIDHPQPLLNDQWLIVHVEHTGYQPEVLEGYDPEDTQAIVAAWTERLRDRQSTFNASPDAAWPHAAWPHNDASSAVTGYRNSFSVLPWTLAFRPALRHRKATAPGLQQATLLAQRATVTANSAALRLPIRFDWQDASPDQEDDWQMAEVYGPCSPNDEQWSVGSRVWVGYFDNDPDRPAIFASLHNHNAVMPPITSHKLQVDGVDMEYAQTPLQLGSQQRLELQGNQPLLLTTAHTVVELSAERISVCGQQIPLITQGAVPETACLQPEPTDLQLTEGHEPAAQPLPLRIWYIVRMPKPGLDSLARLEPRSFLFEGKTDDKGYLGLSLEQLHELAAEYRHTPGTLCLIHPGHCITLKAWFAQNWSADQHQAFVALNDL